MTPRCNRILCEGNPLDFLDWRQGSGHTVEIYDIVVNSERRMGKGRIMINRLLDQLPHGTVTVYAITRSTNIIAKHFYEEMGFRVIGNLWNFYKDTAGIENGVDAVMYGRDVTPLL